MFEKSKDFIRRGPAYYVCSQHWADTRGLSKAANCPPREPPNSFNVVHASVGAVFTDENLLNFVSSITNSALRVRSKLLAAGKGGKDVNVYRILSQFALANCMLLAFGVKLATFGDLRSLKSIWLLLS